LADLLGPFSIQHWLESAAQGYLKDTQYGHEPGETEPVDILEHPRFREEEIRITVQLVVGERCALAASSGLINATPDESAKRFLATQTLDEARHVEIFTQRLLDLGTDEAELESTIQSHANPDLVKFAEVLLEKVERKDFVAGVVGQNIVLEGMVLHVCELLHAANAARNPKFAHTLSGAIADERRHVGFGENRIGSLIREHPERKADIGRMQKEMSYYMLATFSSGFREGLGLEEIRRIREEAGAASPDEEERWQGTDLRALPRDKIELLLAATVLADYKERLERLGIEYQAPECP
jgi:rubrerythrin